MDSRAEAVDTGGARPGGCLPYPHPIWQGMIPLQREVPDPSDDRARSVVAWVDMLLQGAARLPLACPRCGRTGPLTETLNHLFAVHDATFGESAAWLEHVDPDLYALAVHYLASKDRAGIP